MQPPELLFMISLGVTKNERIQNKGRVCKQDSPTTEHSPPRLARNDPSSLLLSQTL